MMDVVREVLDKNVVDRNGREMGRVDGILLQLESGQPPRLHAILIGPAALASRLHPRLGRLARTIEQRLNIDRDQPASIDVADVDQFDSRIRLRLAIGDTTVGAIERRLREWISKLPGSQ
jgi:sporulation protein YlmC with PRC-barrel domain